MTHHTGPDRCSVNPRATPSYLVPLLTAVFTLVFTPLAVVTWRQARVDWLSVSTDGTVASVRLIRYDRPLPRANGPWHVVWEVEGDTAEAERVSVVAPGSYRREQDAEKASRDEVGRRVTVWHVPGEDSLGSLHPPDWRQGLFAAVWTTAMALVGWLGVAACVHFLWRKWGSSSAITEPGVAPDQRST